MVCWNMAWPLLVIIVTLLLHITYVAGFRFGSIKIGFVERSRMSRIGSASLDAKKELESVASQPKVLDNSERTYCFCSRCKSAFFMDVSELGRPGRRVMCGVCNRDWYQTTDSLLKTGNAALILPMPSEQVEQAKRNAAGNFVRYNHKTKATVFVGNLPTSYTEKDIEDIFAEYGILSTQLIRDRTDGTSKGFAFLEICEQTEADRLIKEMHNYYTAPNMRMTVKAAAQQPPQTNRRHSVTPISSTSSSSSPQRTPLLTSEETGGVIASTTDTARTAGQVTTATSDKRGNAIYAADNVNNNTTGAPMRRVWNRHARKVQTADPAS